MTLYEQWNDWLENGVENEEQQRRQWMEYYQSEQAVYETLLADKRNHVEGKLADLAAEFNLNNILMMGFLDGINTSLGEALKLEELAEDTDIVLDIDWEKLYFNMHKAKANWLYNLKQWDGILDEKRRREITHEYRLSVQAVSQKVGRNDPCPCGSGKKYKHCCGAK